MPRPKIPKKPLKPRKLTLPDLRGQVLSDRGLLDKILREHIIRFNADVPPLTDAEIRELRHILDWVKYLEDVILVPRDGVVLWGPAKPPPPWPST